MARIMKYELIKNRFRYLIMISVLVLAEAGFLIANAINFKMGIAMSLVLFLAAWGTLFIVLIEGIAMYNRDLREKSGYMVFMTPLPAWQILLGKILVILLVGSCLFLGYSLLGFLDLHLLAQSMIKADIAPGPVFAASFLDSLYGMNGLMVLLRSLGSLLRFVVFFVCLAYLSSTVSASLLRGKKGEKAISFILFVVLLILVTVLTTKVAGSYGISIGMREKTGVYIESGETAMQAILASIILLGSAFLSFLASSYLLDQKVDI